MAIISRKPENPSLRAQQFISTKHLTKKDPEKSLVTALPKTGGRNAYGRITVRHRGGGAKRKYRIIDFKRIHRDISGSVIALEYDPNRNVSIALVVYKNGAKSYILSPDGLKVGSEVMASVDAEAKVGYSLPLRKIPVGFFVHNVELYAGRGGKFARSAGTSVQLMAKEGEFAILKMPSSEIRKISLNCWATIGILSNADYRNITLGKAGRTRHLGFRPAVRGMAMNPVDHPHGGGEGRSKSGSHPVTPWGKCCKGMRTRKRSNDAIIRRRKP
ncbi:TPA: 50S ribosomal protein L2 [Candidatus Dependentiae bacterium]|nr:MAG: 50S ribosomal protein L2 [candidate division TM6 bacterium GW2011_GWE2_31_21]KKP53124.1 MAG: 50S ribosomal protein L2 [candidate division TM6 bacterium GW2011_GWF2_33_332]HBS47943.1 50S ribosomal protein L2 [Candidatus Dependentiae bacterium]HBZ73453.1 50S ribosomal protein L2 [Candidatus Dependentiae bacterium]